VTRLQLSIALEVNDVTRLVHEGAVRPEGIDLAASNVHSGELIWRQLRFAEFDAASILIPDTTLLDRSRPELQRSTGIRALFEDPVAESLRFYRKTGLYPINHCVAVRRSILERHPWVALNLYHAFLEAKERVVAQTRALLDPYFRLGLLPPEGRATLNADPFPYGLKQNRTTLDAMGRYCHDQGLTSRRVAPEEIFAVNTLAL
jgi:4,5-dihydroxyphthalate decarboxylase